MFDFKRLEEDIKIENHKTYWVDWYEEEKVILEAIFKGNLSEIEHIGSSSVKDLVSKPIVDILIGLKNFEITKKCPRDVRDYFLY